MPLPVPSLPLAVPFTARLRVNGFWIFEKIDGIRAFWDSKNLITRSGSVLPLNLRLPASTCLDGGLFAGSFERTIQALKSGNFDACEFKIFDAWNPETVHLPFSSRFRLLSELKISDSRCSVLPCLGQVTDNTLLDRKLQEIISMGGEGLMLRDSTVPVVFGRSETLVKVKGFFDADAEVVEHVICKRGKMFGRLAALVVRHDGSLIRVGSGFSEHDRILPPPIGSRVSFGWKHVFSHSGLPKVPFFLRRID